VEAGLEPRPDLSARLADGSSLLPAIERIGAEVASLTRLVSAQPEEVAARVGFDVATSVVAVRIGALGSALDQLRLSLLAGLDRNAERLEQPAWLPELLDALGTLAARLDHAVADLPTRDGFLAAVAATDPSDRLLRLEGALTELAEAARADTASVTGLLAAQPDRLARHLDDATLAVTTHLDALGGTLDQLRLTFLDVLGRTTDRIDQPAWLPALQERLGELAAPASAGSYPALGEVGAKLDRLAADPRLDGLTAAVTDLGQEVRAGSGVADALGGRLAAVEAAAAQAGEEARLLIERVTLLPDRLGAIAAQVDRLTPLARAGDEAGSLVGQLDRLNGGLDRVMDRLTAAAEATTGPGPDSPEDGRLAPIVEALAGVTQRQDEVTSAVAAFLDQAQGPKSVDSVLDRMEQRERSLAARLDRIDASLRTRSPGGPLDEGAGALDAERSQLLDALLQAVRRQEQTFADRLEQPVWLPALQEQLKSLAALAGPDLASGAQVPSALGELDAKLNRLAADPRLDGLTAAVTDLGERLPVGSDVADAIEALAIRLTAIEAADARAAEEARDLTERVAPVADRLGAIAAQVDRLTPLARVGDEAGSLVGQLDRVGAGLDQVMVHLSASADTSARRDEGADAERLDGVVEMLTGVARRQDEVTAAVASVLDQAQGPKSVDAVLDRMEQRERSLAARLDRIDAQVRALGARPAPDANSAGPPLDAVLRRLEEQEQAVARQLDWVGDRLAEVAAHLLPTQADESMRSAGGPVPDDRLEVVVEALTGIARRQDQLATRFSALAAQRQAVPAPLPPPAKEAAERRLAELRAERAQVKVRLEQERLLASQAWEDDPIEDGFDDGEPV